MNFSDWLKKQGQKNMFVNYLYNIWWSIYSIASGMGLTFKEMLKPTFTINYPFETLEFTGFRGKLVNYTADCISCNKCVVACPVDCISLESRDREDFDPQKHKASTGHPLRLELVSYDIDMNKCMYCNLCTEVCPTECLVMTDDIEYSSDDRDDMTIAFCEDSATGIGRQ
ncbi:MAG: NADH-quinone oxidoreductase subunit I [bacterium]